MEKVLQVALAFALLCVSHAYKIVWVPHSGAASHQMLALKVGEELVARGHEVIIVNAHHIERYASKFNSTSGVKTVLYTAADTTEERVATEKELGAMEPLDQVKKLVHMQVANCDNLLSDKTIMDQLKGADVVVSDMTDVCGSVLQDFLQIPYRTNFLPVNFFDPFFLPVLGGVNPWTYVPQMGSRLTCEMNFGERIKNLITKYVNQAVVEFLNKPLFDDLREKHGLPRGHFDMTGINGITIVQEVWATEYPRPVPPSVRMVGPILAEVDPKPLPADLLQFIEGAEAGVILASYGTTSTVSEETVKKTLSAFGKVKFPVIFKNPGDISIDEKDVPDNVKLVQWIPQNGLLGHPKVIAFVSHGGLNGINEAAFHGVPVIGVPSIGDQFDNLGRLQYRGMCIMLEAHVFTAQDLANAINEVATTPSFTENAKRISAMVKDVPTPPAEAAAYWIEYTVRHEGALVHMLPMHNTHWFIKEGYDVVITLLVLNVVLPFYLIKWCCCGKKAPKEKTS